MLLCLAHPHLTTTSPNRQQLRVEAAAALGVLYSSGNYSGKSMANTNAPGAPTHGKTKSHNYDRI